ncbi:nucleotide exchange factor GrpE [Demetria terragena]|uniref:nucleotide exchange factor GrpE n=1 Tax=Demetria terragena TaxID=63959 RepID=UPI000377D7D4|nr:nucleotide exchange factor GrpE [Demetria terragena]
MTDVNPTPAGSQEPAGEEPTIIRDRRRIDPETGEVRTPSASSEATEATSEPKLETETDDVAADPGLPEGETEAEGPLAAELQDELLREKAARHNERERFKRERSKDREASIGSVVESLLPVLDDVHYAREHGELAGTPFEKIADKLEAILGRYGVETIGAVGDPFDPSLHEALMHVEAEVPEGSEGTTVVQVIQPGFKIGDRVVRAARVSVADPV